MAGCPHASTCGWVGGWVVGGRVSSCRQLGLFPEGVQATGSPGEVDHDVSVALMHLSKGEWCHITPHLEGLCHCLPHLLAHQLPWEPKDSGGRSRVLGFTQCGAAPEGYGARSCPWMLCGGACMQGTGQMSLRCDALTPLPHGHIFVWVCVLRRTQVSAFSGKNTGPGVQDLPYRPDCAAHCGETVTL